MERKRSRIFPSCRVNLLIPLLFPLATLLFPGAGAASAVVSTSGPGGGRRASVASTSSAAPAGAHSVVSGGPASAGGAAGSGDVLGTIRRLFEGAGTGLRGREASWTVKALLLLTLFSLVPAFLALATSYVRISVILHFLRHAMGLPGVPSDQILAGLAVLLTWMNMFPVFETLRSDVLQPCERGELEIAAALARSERVIKRFMLSRTDRRVLVAFASRRGIRAVRSPEEIDLDVVLSAYVVSELGRAFKAGLTIWIPFLMIDILVALLISILGLTAFPGSTYSVPLKLMAFVALDGWMVIARGLMGGG